MDGKRVLGLDVGANSLGWALIDHDAKSIVDMGVRIFQAGVDNINGMQEASRSLQRRLKRALRKQYKRRRERKNLLRTKLIMLGLLPDEPERFADVVAMDPYTLRKKALDVTLEVYELGRVLDHINSRRGFRTNRKVMSEDETSGTIYEGAKDADKPGINVVTDALDPRLRRMKDYTAVREQLLLNALPPGAGSRTIGEYLADLNPRERRRRNRFTLREHYEIETDIILRKHVGITAGLTVEAIEEIMNIMFDQRPLKTARIYVGPCRFEPSKKRCRKSHPEFQRFRMLQQVNQLRVSGPGRIDDEEQRLKDDERGMLIDLVTMKGELRELDKKESNLRELKKILGLPKTTPISTNIERIDAEYTRRAVTKALGIGLTSSYGPDEWHQIWNVLNHAEHSEWLQDWAVQRLGVSQQQALEFSRIKLESGHASISLKAIRRMMPFLERGYMYHEAATHAGYAFTDSLSQVTLQERVPGLLPSEARNPIVQRSFSELRKVVNAILAKYGPVDTIRVEMGRELRQPLKKRLKDQKIAKENEDYNNRVRNELSKSFGFEHVSRADIQRLKLWESQNHQCIYTGAQISLHQLFSGAVDVDHIIPYSRCMIDGMGNKVVCLREANAAKGNRTPREAIDEGILDGSQLRERLESLVRMNKVSSHKARQFFMSTEEVEKFIGGDFIERQLNDTRFVAKLATKYLRMVAPQVGVSNGVLTAGLRHRWGLNGVIPELAAMQRAWVDDEAIAKSSKSRADHRHHAIDALVVALTNQSLLQKVSTLNAAGLGSGIEQHEQAGRLRLPEEPIPGLRAMARDRIDAMIVSHRVNTRKQGALHEETIYGRARNERGEQRVSETGLPLYVVRKPIESLTCKELLSVVDAGVRSLLLSRLQSLGIDVTAPKFEIPKTAFLEPIFMNRKDGKRGHRIRSVRVLKPSKGMKQIRGGSAFVEPGSNDHIQLGEFDEHGKRSFWNVVQTFDAVKVNRPNERYVSYRINELYGHPDSEEIGASHSYYRVQKLDKTGTVTFRHHAAATLEDNKSRLFATPNTMRGIKVVVNVLGHIVDSRK